MKNAFLAVSVLLLGLSFQATAETPSTSPQLPSMTPIANTAAAPIKKSRYKEFKAECLKENPSLKGIELRKCVKAKNQPAQ